MIALWALAVVQDRVPAVASQGGAAATSGSFDISNIITLILAIGSSTVVGAVVNAFANRKRVSTENDRTKADAAAELTGIATSLVAPLRAQNAQLTEDFAAYRVTVAEQHDKDAEAWQQAWDEQAAFAQALLRLLAENGIEHDLVAPASSPPPRFVR